MNALVLILLVATPAKKHKHKTHHAAVAAPIIAPEKKPAPEKNSQATVTPAPAAAAPTNLNFDLLAPTAPTDIAAQKKIEDAIYRRRVMLQLHTSVGVALLVATTANVVFGALNYYDVFGGGGDTNRYYLAHEISAYTTFGLFATNMILGLAAPNPFQKKLSFGRTMMHEIFMFTAAAGFVTEIVLGIISAGQNGRNDQPQWAVAHLTLGCATSALVYAGAAVFVF